MEKQLTEGTRLNASNLRNGWLKPVACTLVAMGFLIMFVGGKELPSDSPKTQNFRVANSLTQSSASLDPANIRTIYEYVFIENLFSRLVEYNKKNELVPGVASSFYWKDGRLFFEFENKTRTKNGYPISASDAATSLKRAIFFKRTGHADLRKLVCPNVQLSSVDDECEGIKVSGNTLILTPIKQSYGPVLLTLLENADFSIIPKIGLNTDPSDPRLIDLKNTSGPFYISKDDANGAWQLTANHNHYHYRKDMPQVIDLVPASYEVINELFETDKVDLAPITLPLIDSYARKIAESGSGYSYFESMPIRVLSLYFTPKCVDKTSPQQRFLLGNVLRGALEKIVDLSDGKPTSEFLQALSDGSIDETQRAEINRLRSAYGPLPQNLRLTLMVRKPNYAKWKDALKDFKQIEVIGSDEAPVSLPLSERPDIYFGETDAAWTESLSLLEYNFNVGSFHLPGLDSNAWIQGYIETEDREKRVTALKHLHFKLLENAVIYPISSGPYYAFARNGWSLDFGTVAGGSELWRITRKP